MGDENQTEDLEDVSGGPDSVTPSITDDLEDVDGGVSHLAVLGSDRLQDVDGGLAPLSPAAVTDTDPLQDATGDFGTNVHIMHQPDPLKDVDGGGSQFNSNNPSANPFGGADES